MNDAYRGPAETAVWQCMNLRPDESCVVVTDDGKQAFGEALYEVAREITDDAVIVRYPPGDEHGEEPPAPVAAAMRDADVVLAPTTKSVSHTRARGAANEAGARVATMPDITEDVFLTGLDADYEAIAAECERVLELVADAETVRVTSPQGTDITVRPGDRAWRDDTGIVHDPGAMSNLPAGEVFVAPETADGTYVIDGTIMPHGLVPDPITVTVEDGYVTGVDDDALREKLERAAGKLRDAADYDGETGVDVPEDPGRAAYNFAELGIGTNVAVTELVGSVLLDEKAGGTVHLAIGDDAGIGGDTDAPVHLDGILREPTVFADGEELELPRA